MDILYANLSIDGLDTLGDGDWTRGEVFTEV